MKIIRIVGLADGRPSPVDGAYVVDCDVDGRGGRGVIHATGSPDDARHFRTTEESVDFYRRQSKVLPLRPDGKPNRPLTAYTVEILDHARLAH